MKKAYKICWVMAAVMSQACHDAEKTPATRFNNDPGFITEIPVEKTGRFAGELDFSYRHLKETAVLLGLDSLEYGYDSLQIRIWLAHSLARVRHVVILSSAGEDWKAQVISYSDTAKGSVKNSMKSIMVSPKSGWPRLVRSISDANIVNLPHGEERSICDQCGGFDGDRKSTRLNS